MHGRLCCISYDVGDFVFSFAAERAVEGLGWLALRGGDGGRQHERGGHAAARRHRLASAIALLYMPRVSGSGVRVVTRSMAAARRAQRQQRFRARYASDEAFRREHRLRSRLYGLLRQMARTNGAGRGMPRLSFVGCSARHLARHLEAQFAPGMRWSGYGREWTLDHVRPVASFDRRDARAMARCHHFSNLRPCSARENLLKGSLYQGSRWYGGRRRRRPRRSSTPRY